MEIKESKKNGRNWIKELIIILVGVMLLALFNLRADAAEIDWTGTFEYGGNTYTYYYVMGYSDSSTNYEFTVPVYGFSYTYDGRYGVVFLSKDYVQYRGQDKITGNYGGYGNFNYNGSLYVYSPSGTIPVYTPEPQSCPSEHYNNMQSIFMNYFLSDDFEEYTEVPGIEEMELSNDVYLTDFAGDNSINASWSGITSNSFDIDSAYINVILGYSFNPGQIATTEVYSKDISVSDCGFYIPWEDAQHENTELFLRYVRVTPYVISNDNYIKGNSSFIYFMPDGNIESVKTPINVDKESLTTNIVGGVYDENIPALSDVVRINNGYTDVMESFSQSVTFNWSNVFESSNYFIQCRTTFRYKLNKDAVWETITIDTSVPNGRYSTFVDDKTFTYHFGNYADLFWKQDDSIWTDDDLNKQGNIQPIKDSIRIVHIEDGLVSYGPWTTFTLKNGIWETGKVTGSYVSSELNEDNTSVNIPDSEKDKNSFLNDFDYTNVSGIWDMFVGMFKNLVSFLGSFPVLFSKVFSFLPYEIRSMIYLSIICICVLGLGKAVIK